MLMFSPLTFSHSGKKCQLGLNQVWGFAGKYEGGQDIKGLFKGVNMMKELLSKLRKEGSEDLKEMRKREKVVRLGDYGPSECDGISETGH